MSTPASSRLPAQAAPACPECGGAVMRVLRTANDKRRWDAQAWRRYRCRDAMCNWQGLLPARRRRPSRPRPGAARTLRRLARALLWLLLAGLVAGGGLAALHVMLQP